MDVQTENTLVIEAGRSEKNYWKDLWRYRELFYFLSWRDILVRYKQTVIGIAWSVIRPFLTMVVFTIVFGKLAKLPSEGIPYPLLVFTALLPWQFFANSLGEASTSIISNANMLTKVYFPRIVIPATSIIVSLMDLLISFVMLFFLMAWYGFTPSVRAFTLPLFLILACVASFGVSLWLSALNVKYRDFRYVVPFIVQFGLYVSPVGFSSGIVPERWRFLYSLNPMVGVIDGFRWALLSEDMALYWPGITLSTAITTVILVSGFKYFRKTEKIMADVI
jgi:lipopolysaccharide transport system permease protein